LPQYRNKAREALKKADREDLIGRHKNALVPPEANTEQRARKNSPHAAIKSMHRNKQRRR